MKKLFAIVLFTIIVLMELFSFNLSGTYDTNDPSIQIELNENNYGKQLEYGGKVFQEFTYKQKTINHLEFIYDISKPILRNPFSADEVNNEISEILVLSAKINYKGKERDFVLGYDNDVLFINSAPKNSMESHCFYKDCSSFLVEGSKKYTTENLSENDIGSPWIEGVSGNGEGEGFTIEGNASYLFIINGFVSSQKPYLYEQNSRIQTLKIIGSKSGKSMIVKLLDTPNPQTVDISFLDKNDDTVIRIESVYPGTKYQDSCITMCRLFWWQVTPVVDLGE